MKKWLKRIALISLVATMALSLTACGQNKSSNSGKKVTIEYFNQKKEMSATLKEIIKDFEKKHTNLVLDHESTDLRSGTFYFV